MTEAETMQRAKMYIDKLAKGINPLDDSVIPEGDIINNVRLSRCLFYVSDILGKVIENGGINPPKKPKKKSFNISFEQIQRFQFSDAGMQISKIAEMINALVDNPDMKKLTHGNITQWLVSIDMLRIEKTSDGHNSKRPTDSGREIGIYTEEKTGVNGPYTAVVYNRTAQQFIVDNIDAIIDHMINYKKPKNEENINT